MLYICVGNGCLLLLPDVHREGEWERDRTRMAESRMANNSTHPNRSILFSFFFSYFEIFCWVTWKYQSCCGPWTVVVHRTYTQFQNDFVFCFVVLCGTESFRRWSPFKLEWHKMYVIYFAFVVIVFGCFRFHEKCNKYGNKMSWLTTENRIKSNVLNSFSHWEIFQLFRLTLFSHFFLPRHVAHRSHFTSEHQNQVRSKNAKYQRSREGIHIKFHAN